MDPYEIEDTSDWFGCPAELETCRHFLRMYENEVQELTLAHGPFFRAIWPHRAIIALNNWF